MASVLQVATIKDQGGNNNAIEIANSSANVTINNLAAGTIGSAVTFPTGSIVNFQHSSTTPTAQTSSSSHTDVTGTSMTYTPATGASKVFYQTRFVVGYEDTRIIAHFKILHDGSTVSGTRQTIDSAGSATYWTSQIIISHVFTAWSGSRVTKVQFREYSSSYDSKLHNSQFWDGSSSGNQILDVHTFMYSIM